MLLPLVCAAVYLLLSVRILADVSLEISEVRCGVGLCLRAWGVCLCADRPVKRSFDRKRAGKGISSLRQYGQLIRAAVRSIRWGQTDIHMRVGAQDASHTAVIAGAVRSGASMLQAIAGQRFPCDVRIEPDFRTPAFVLTGRCIFSLVPGDIMFAVLREAVKKTQREGFKWLSTPLKA